MQNQIDTPGTFHIAFGDAIPENPLGHRACWIWLSRDWHRNISKLSFKAFFIALICFASNRRTGVPTAGHAFQERNVVMLSAHCPLWGRFQSHRNPWRSGRLESMLDLWAPQSDVGRMIRSPYVSFMEKRICFLSLFHPHWFISLGLKQHECGWSADDQ